MLVQGWLLDCYPSKTSSGMTAWIKTEDGRALQLKDSAWHAKIYAGGQACENIDYFVMRADAKNLVHSISHAFKRSDFFDTKKKRVLEIELADASRTRKLAELLERAFRNPKAMQLYNVDVMPEQQYFLEKDLFPLAFVEVDATDDGEVRRWTMLDSASSCVYETPKLKILRLALEIEDLVPRLDSKLVSISLFSPEDDGDGKEKEEEQERKIAKIEGTSEADIIRELGDSVDAFDPDLIITQNGDAFVLPFLYTKAAKFGIDLHSKLNRDHELSSSPNEQKSGGKTYFSYGRILYRPTTHRLFGRLHLDEENTFVYDQCMLEGLFEVSRLCRMPIHTSMRASIGKCLSGLQFYYAYKEDILIPWKPEIPEDFKMGQELFDDDRGGLVLKPLSGVHEHVGELDFASLYPSIIKSFNISAETVNCSCCGKDSDSPSKFQIEELHMHVCERKKGIVARSLAQPLLKKAWYKTLRDTAKKNGDEVLARKYNERAASLKWILVCCLAKETPVLIRRDGIVKYAKIGSFIDSVADGEEGSFDCRDRNIFVAGVDENLKSKFCKVKRLLKIPNQHSRLLNIVMDDGRRTVVTPNHPCYLLKEGNLEVRQASELKEGNFIPVAKRLPSLPARNEQFIDVIDRLTKSLDSFQLGRWRVSGSILSKALIEKKQIVLAESVRAGYSRQSIRVWIRKGIVPLRFFNLLNISIEERQTLRVRIGRVKGKFGRTSWIPAVIPINEMLGFFLGLYASSGSTTNTYIRLDIGYFETDLLENACKIAQSLFQTVPHVYKEKNANVFIVQINNLALVKFVEQVLGIPNTSEKGKLKVPEMVFNSDEIVAQGFIEGVLAGDGSMNKVRTFASIATVSRDFANQIGFLAASLNLSFRLATHPRAPPLEPIYTINFVAPETLKAISQWKYLKLAHLAILGPKLQNLCNENGNLNCTHPVYQMFPTDESGVVLLARKARTIRTPRIDQTDAACPYRMTQTLERIASSKRLDEESIFSLTNVRRMFQGDLGFARIRKIEELSDRTDDYVYCFELEDGEVPGFFAGDGAVFTHNCFGYLSYRNAKFGKIDSHIAVCALARKTLVEAMHVSEYNGFRVVHGIVDSLWLEKKNASESDYVELRAKIEKQTKFKLAFEGIYKWVVFLPSKTYPGKQVANRYFGVFETGEIKTRGIEMRRHDAPLYFKKCQKEILEELARCENERELRICARQRCVDIFERYALDIEGHKVSPTELLIKRRLSKNPSEYYSARQLSVNASSHLERRGLALKAGQSVSYVITRYKSSGVNRSTPEQLVVGDNLEYDSERYVELLADACATLLTPFGVTKEELLGRSRSLLAW